MTPMNRDRATAPEEPPDAGMSKSWNKGVRGTQVLPLINNDAETMRVVAGPGTGKTFGLVRRVERILHPEGLAADGQDDCDEGAD
jgi:hypothetical protein